MTRQEGTKKNRHSFELHRNKIHCTAICVEWDKSILILEFKILPTVNIKNSILRNKLDNHYSGYPGISCPIIVSLQILQTRRSAEDSGRLFTKMPLDIHCLWMFTRSASGHRRECKLCRSWQSGSRSPWHCSHWSWTRPCCWWQMQCSDLKQAFQIMSIKDMILGKLKNLMDLSIFIICIKLHLTLHQCHGAQSQLPGHRDYFQSSKTWWINF